MGKLEADRGVNQDQLKALITAAATLKADRYTPESYANLQTEITAAKTVSTDAGASQKQIQEAIQSLSRAWFALVLTQTQPQSDLAQWVRVAEALNPDQYTPASFDKLTAALAEAKRRLLIQQRLLIQLKPCQLNYKPPSMLLCRAEINNNWPIC